MPVDRRKENDMPYAVWRCSQCQSEHNSSGGARECEEAHETARRLGMDSLDSR